MIVNWKSDMEKKIERSYSYESVMIELGIVGGF